MEDHRREYIFEVEIILATSLSYACASKKMPQQTIEIYPYDLCHQDAMLPRQQLIDKLT